MEFYDFVPEFIERTKSNLEEIEQHHRRKPEDQQFEVTQLVNSMLGLLVIPRDHHMKQMPPQDLAALESGGWPIPRTSAASEKHPSDLRGLVDLMRHAFAHGNLEFIPDETAFGPHRRIATVRMWNHKHANRELPKDWEADVSVADLRGFAYHFVDWLLACLPSKPASFSTGGGN